MDKIEDESIELIITSPPYFNIKDYSMDGTQDTKHSNKIKKDIGGQESFEKYIKLMEKVWKECFRVLKPNGKLCINVPLLPMIKKDYSTHYNRHIFDLQSEIQKNILNNTKFFLMDLYIWNRTNSTKKLMFGSYPYPGNFYAQNTIEFITVYVKDGKSNTKRTKKEKEKNSLSVKEWTTFTKQVWDIPIPNKGDIAFGEHSAIMPEEIPKRLIRMFSFEGDTILDPFAGSGTTMKVAKELKRNSIGYELYEHYATLIDKKVGGINVKK
ncbi:MAG: site-specific DNA-methyltransferase [Mycoplasma sp.]|nr:site-specific DNA-methyltransferase [Mycoplasma sp.]